MDLTKFQSELDTEIVRLQSRHFEPGVIYMPITYTDPHDIVADEEWESFMNDLDAPPQSEIRVRIR